MLAGNTMLLPKSMTENPEAFNKGQLNGPGPSAGPFIVSNLDRTAQRIVLTRNPKWWGTPPLLDTHHLPGARRRRTHPGAAEQHHRRHRPHLAGRADHRPRTAGVAIRRAPATSWYHFTFNGAPGSILADKDLRLAISKGIDRQAIADVTQRGLADNPATAQQPHLSRRPGGLPGQQRCRRLRPGEGQAGTRCARLDAERPVPRKGRQAAGDPRRVLRRAEHPADRSDRAEQPRPDRGQARVGHGARRQSVHRLRHGRQLRHRTVRLGGRRRSRCPV